MAYTIEFTPKAAHQLRNLPRKTQRFIARRIDTLADNPLPRDCEKLSGEESFFRIRTGSYRIIYKIENRQFIVLIVRIGHRRDVYRRL